MWPIFQWLQATDICLAAIMDIFVETTKSCEQKCHVSLQPGRTVVIQYKVPFTAPWWLIGNPPCPPVSPVCNWPRSGWNNQTNEIFLIHLMALPTPSIPQRISGQCMAALAASNWPGQQPGVCMCLLLSVSLNNPESSCHTCHLCHALSTC